ncbi:hypothetical protein ALC56_11807 [Trachymyrmex septentrionalis]|uniref:Uncharacterized protein n=1 Tax=Trachymyrmex septentrionalis TaxID=34720 RepID=A0A151JTI6_9HYME|nr:hypothetical protein ALC56_11807 [Trachymyrmex septentrionalis]
MLTGICSMGKCPLKFYDLKIYGKTHVSGVEKASMHHRHGTTQNLPLNVACPFLNFVITDSRELSALLTVNLGAGLTLSIRTYLLLIFISKRHSRGDTGFLVLVFNIEKKKERR